MARKPKGYWEKRQTELLKQLEKATEPTIKDLIKIYNKATSNINEEIRKIYKNYSKDSTLSKEVLNQLLNKKESEIHQKNLLKVINNNIKDEDLKKKLITKYNAPAYSYRISRLQALQENIDIELKHIAELEEEITKLRYVNTIDESYYHNIYDIQKGTGYGFNFSQLDTRTMDILLKQKWIGNGNFSTRIWQNNDRLNKFMKINFAADMMTGKSVQKIAKELSEYMNIGLYNATRLVRTETNYFANASELLAYEECGIDRYEFIATLDNVTCDRCASLDKKVFKVKEAKQGVNCPPMHSNDRCTTVAYFGDEEVENLQRRARDENGNSILVPSDMSYQQWKEKFLSNDEGIIENIKYDIKTKGYIDVTRDKNKIINSSFKNEKIKNIALNTKIRKIRIGGNQSSHNSGNIVLIKDYLKRTVVHEIAHCVDYNNKWISSSKKFIEAIKKDREIINNNKLLYKNLIKENIQLRELSDIIGGMTNNEIVGNYKHKNEYWLKNHKLEREAFAQLFTIAGNDDIKQLELFSKYLPNITKEFDNIIKELL